MSRTITAILRDRPKRGATVDEILDMAPQMRHGLVSNLRALEKVGTIRCDHGRFFFVREKERIVWQVLES